MLRLHSRLPWLDIIRVNYMCRPLLLKSNGINFTQFNLTKLKCSTHSGTSVAFNQNPEIKVPESSQFNCIIKCAQELGFAENNITTLLEKYPDLTRTSTTLWDNILGCLLNFGLPKQDVLSILEKWPRVLFLKKSDLEQNLEAWFSCNFGQELVCDLLTTHPSFLQVNHRLILQRVKQYQLYFESKKRVGKLLLLAPNTLEEKWQEILDKLNYLDELCTDKSDIVSSRVLAYSCFHTRARHEFLIRSGVYKRPQKNFQKKLSKNPKLTSIVNTNDKEFVTSIAKLSMLEYQTFLEMFEKESPTYETPCDSDDEEELRKLSYTKHQMKKRNNC